MSPRPRSATELREAAGARRARRGATTDADVVMAAAAAFLALRPRSVTETRARLRHLGYPHALCDEVLDRLVDLGYLDDLAFSRAWVESRDRARPRGAVALRHELLAKGVPREAIDEVLADRSASAAGSVAGAAPPLPSADTAAARRLLAGREATLRREDDPRRRRQRAYALLARHGFTPDVCRDVAASIVAGEPDVLDDGPDLAEASV